MTCHLLGHLLERFQTSIRPTHNYEQKIVLLDTTTKQGLSAGGELKKKKGGLPSSPQMVTSSWWPPIRASWESKQAIGYAAQLLHELHPLSSKFRACVHPTEPAKQLNPLPGVFGMPRNDNPVTNIGPKDWAQCITTHAWNRVITLWRGLRSSRTACGL